MKFLKKKISHEKNKININKLYILIKEYNFIYIF